MSAWRNVLACLICLSAPWDKADLGFFWSTLFLMAVPLAVAGLIGGWLYYSHSIRRSAARRQSQAALAGLTATEKESGQ